MATVETRIEKLPPEARSIEVNPSREALRQLARHDEHTTTFGAPAYVTEVRARSAKATRTTVDGEVTDADLETIREVREYLKDRDLIQIDRVLGDAAADRAYSCRLYITKPFARLALMFQASLLPPRPDMQERPDFVTIDVPDWPGDRAILVDTVEGITYVLNSDYYGEIKKSVLRQVMYRAKQEGALGLHAGSKEVSARSGRNGGIKRHGMLFFGLSGTGKTSLTCHDFGLEGAEGIHVRQDDVVLLDPDGRCRGTEGGGFYIKTENLSPEDQAALYGAATSPDAILENVWVEEDGRVDFHNTTLTGNGRAVVPIEQVKNTDGSIDLETVDKIFFITRNPLVPAACRLTPEQAAVAFVLGESIKTSAADPNARGEPVRVVGTNPFIVGPRGEEGNILYGILQENPEIESYILNTGHVGEGDGRLKIRLLDTVSIIRAIAREAIEWQRAERLGLEIPKAVEGVDARKFRIAEHYSAEELDRRLAEQRRARREWLDSFDTFDADLKEAVY